MSIVILMLLLSLVLSLNLLIIHENFQTLLLSPRKFCHPAGQRHRAKPPNIIITVVEPHPLKPYEPSKLSLSPSSIPQITQTRIKNPSTARDRFHEFIHSSSNPQERGELLAA